MVSLDKSSLEELLHLKDIAHEHFSKNEEIDEVKTVDLPYICTDYFIALKYIAIQNDRLANLEKAYSHLNDFFTWLARFGIAVHPSTTSDPAVQRQEKIARYQCMTELRASLDPCEPAMLDGDAQRSYWLRWLQLRGLQAVEEYIFIAREIELLQSHMLSGSSSNSNNGSARAHHVQSPTNTIRVTRPFVLTKTGRELVQDSVFKPGHQLPTMSIDEFLELERERGNMITGTVDSAHKVDPETDADFDSGTRKLRQRDERWDWIARGTGNRHNRS